MATIVQFVKSNSLHGNMYKQTVIVTSEMNHHMVGIGQGNKDVNILAESVYHRWCNPPLLNTPWDLGHDQSNCILLGWENAYCEILDVSPWLISMK